MMETVSEEGQAGNTGPALVNGSMEKGQTPTDKLDDKLDDALGWETAVENPRNWPSWRKMILLAAMSSSAITAYVCRIRINTDIQTTC